MPKGQNTKINNYLQGVYSASLPTRLPVDTTTLIVRNLAATGGDQTKAFQTLLTNAKNS